ncbi:MAG: MFS transporter [Planctomycetaceae bacterium]|nr:MFS transporter [Planctomycetaceae bacterium]
MTTPAPGISKGKQWLIILLLMWFVGLGHFNRNNISVVGTERFIEEKVFSKDQMSQIYSALLFFYTLLMIPGGWFIDRFGPRFTLAVMGFASALLVAMTGLIGIVPGLFGLGSFIVVRGVLGAFYSPLHPACARMVSLTISTRRQALANGLVTGAALVGISSMYFGFGTLMDRFDWTGAFVVSGLLSLLVTVIWLCIPMQSYRMNTGGSSSTKENRSLSHDLKEFLYLLTNRRLLLLSFSYGAYSYAQYLFFYWMQLYFEETLNLKPPDSRFYSTIPMLAMAVGMPLGGWISDRLATHHYHPGYVPIIALIIGAVVAPLGTMLADPLQVSICYSIALGMLGLCEGPYWTLGISLGRRSGGMSGAVLNTIGNAGGIVATRITPMLSAVIGSRGSFAVTGIACLIAAILWLPLRFQLDEESTTVAQ